jgi:hypothetical protein
MRSGRLLAEDSPENLLRDYNQTSLENVFLELCIKNDENKLTSIVTNEVNDPVHNKCKHIALPV